MHYLELATEHEPLRLGMSLGFTSNFFLGGGIREAGGGGSASGRGNPWASH